MLIKTSDRTLRSDCSKCGVAGSELYWAKDDTKGDDHPFVMVAANDYTRSIPKGGEIADMFRHVCGSPLPAPEADAKALPPIPAPIPTPGNADAALTREQKILAGLKDLLAEPIDRDEVREIARQEAHTVAAGIITPTQTAIIRDGVTTTVDGLTHQALGRVIRLANRQNLMLVGPAGTGKTTIARQVSEAYKTDFRFISVGPNTSKSDFVGFIDANGTVHRTGLREVWEHGGVFLFDEVDAGHPGVLTFMNACLDGAWMEFPDAIVPKHKDVRFLASANTYGRGMSQMYVGRNKLDAAFLDRFGILPIDIDEALESAVVHGLGVDASTVDRVLKYVRPMRKIAEDNQTQVILSPRATIGMVNAIAEGDTFEEALDLRVRKGLKKETWDMLTKNSK
jgi:cobaltochelatase CobS